MGTHKKIREASDKLSMASTITEMDGKFEWDREKVKSYLEDVKTVVDAILQEMEIPLEVNK